MVEQLLLLKKTQSELIQKHEELTRIIHERKMIQYFINIIFL